MKCRPLLALPASRVPSIAAAIVDMAAVLMESRHQRPRWSRLPSHGDGPIRKPSPTALIIRMAMAYPDAGAPRDPSTGNERMDHVHAENADHRLSTGGNSSFSERVGEHGEATTRHSLGAAIRSFDDADRNLSAMRVSR
jgi:hypothetical protein